jgi:hypothetical protein
LVELSVVNAWSLDSGPSGADPLELWTVSLWTVSLWTVLFWTVLLRRSAAEVEIAWAGKAWNGRLAGLGTRWLLKGNLLNAARADWQAMPFVRLHNNHNTATALGSEPFLKMAGCRVLP